MIIFCINKLLEFKQQSANDFVLKTRVGGQQIEVGSLNRIDKKFKKLKAFYQKKLKDNTLDNYQTINLKYENQVVCTKK